MNTRVVNLFAGPGAGKSTLAAEIFYKLKNLGYSCEMVREYVKEWAWAGRKISAFDQFYIAATQAQIESTLYGKVEFLISDSPLLLGCFYEKYNHGDSIALPSAIRLMNRAERLGVEYFNFYLIREKDYDSRGRYESKEEASELDGHLEQFLMNNGINYKTLSEITQVRADLIIASILNSKGNKNEGSEDTNS